MTLYNIDKLEALKDEFLEERKIKGTAYGAGLGYFVEFLKEKEKASFFDPNQLEIPFDDEDNSK